MAVGYDAGSISHASTGNTGTPNPFTWTHTTTGTNVKGVLVFTFNNADVDTATGVTYNGVALSAVTGGQAADTGGEAGRTKAWFVTSGAITTADSIVSVSRSGTSAMSAVCITLTADTPTLEVTGVTLEQNNQELTEESIDDGSPGTNSLRFAAVNSGLPSLTATDNSGCPAGANSTVVAGLDYGARVVNVVRETTAGQGARSVGFNSYTGSDDVAAVYLAVRERVRVPTVGLLTFVGAAPALALAMGLTAGALQLTGASPTTQIVAATAVLKQGTTTIASRSLAGATTSYATSAFALTDEERALVTDWTALRVHLSATGRQLEVSWVELEAPGSAGIKTASPGVGELRVVGAAPTLFTEFTIGVGSGGVALTGSSPALALTWPPGVGGIQITGAAPTLRYDLVASPGSVALELVGAAPTALLTLTATPGAGLLQFTSDAPERIVQGTEEFTLAPDPGVLQVVGGAVGAFQAHLAVPDTAALQLAGSTPVTDRASFPASTTLQLTGAAVTLDFVLPPASGTLQLVGAAPDLSPTSRPDAGLLQIVGAAPVAAVERIIPTFIGLLRFAATGPTLDLVLPPSAGAVEIAGAAPTLDVVVPVPSGTVQISGATPVRVDTYATVTLKQGDTVIVTQTLALTTDYATTEISVNPALVTDWTALRVSLVASGRQEEVSWVQLQTPLAYAGTITVGSGTLQVVGRTPVANRNVQIIEPPTGTLQITGSDNAWAFEVNLYPSEPLRVVGQEVDAYRGNRPVPGVGALQIVGRTPIAYVEGYVQPPQAFVRVPEAGLLEIHGWASILLTEAAIPSGTLVVEGAAPLSLVDVPIAVPSGELQLSYQPYTAPLLDFGVPPASGILVVAGAAPDVLRDYTAEPASAVLQLVGQDVNAPATLPSYPDPAVLQLVGSAPTLAIGVGVPVGTVVVAGGAPTLATEVAVGTGALVLGGAAPGVLEGPLIGPDTGLLLLAGQQCYVGSSRTPATGILLLTGLAPTATLLEQNWYTIHFDKVTSFVVDHYELWGRAPHPRWKQAYPEERTVLAWADLTDEGTFYTTVQQLNLYAYAYEVVAYSLKPEGWPGKPKAALPITYE